MIPHRVNSPDQLAQALADDYRRAWVIDVDGGAYVVATNSEDDDGRWLPEAEAAYFVSASGDVCTAGLAYDLYRWRENESRARARGVRDVGPIFGGDETAYERYQEARDDELAAEAG